MLVLATAALTAGGAAAQQPTGPRPTGPRGPEATTYLIVLASSLNVRATPSLEGRVVASVARGDRLCIVRYVGEDWAEVASPRPGEAGPARPLGFTSRGFVSERSATRDELRSMGCGASARR